MKKRMNAIRLRARVAGLGIFARRTWGLSGEFSFFSLVSPLNDSING